MKADQIHTATIIIIIANVILRTEIKSFSLYKKIPKINNNMKNHELLKTSEKLLIYIHLILLIGAKNIWLNVP
ncbi:hypothetical protein SP4011_09320 [Streptococcus parapneumoniae]|uniref:Uncharacterized protein n=1 Tax=Streptococcus parapneumoniae TaxID=2993430 RepID=A0ABM8CGC5_9STRE|nr:hypothetical protein SP4011_09320 [Streptococcus sp. SP4011]